MVGHYIHYVVLVMIITQALGNLIVLNSFTKINISEPQSSYEHKKHLLNKIPIM